MKRLKNQSLPRDDIEDAEFEEVSDERHTLGSTSSRPPLPPLTPPTLGAWWRHQGFFIKTLIVFVPLLFLAMCVAVVGDAPQPAAETANTESEEDKLQNAADQVRLMTKAMEPDVDTQASSSASSATAWLEGSWVLAPTGGEDGGTACTDFNARALYQQNRNTGRVISFNPGGEYREMFAYSTPSGNEHSTVTTARWQQNGDQVAVTDITMRDAFTGAGEPYTLTIQERGHNVLVARSDGGTSRFVRCQGDTAAIYGE